MSPLRLASLCAALMKRIISFVPKEEVSTVQLLCTITIRSRGTGIYALSKILSLFVAQNNFNLSFCLVFTSIFCQLQERATN